MGHERSLGARIQTCLTQPAQILHQRGHAEEIVDVISQNGAPDQPHQVLGAHALENIRVLMHRF